MKNVLLFFIFILILTSCSGEIDLGKKEKIELTFEQLPPDLKEIYGTKFHTTKDTFYYYVYSLDRDYKLTHYWTGMNNQLLTKGFNHHFVINDKEFKLRANKGDPFVLRNKKLYYTTELNLDEHNFEKSNFIEIDLREYLNVSE